jgi:ubiquitin C-terminal hydrolase
VTERDEMYYDLLLQVINCPDLAASFRSYLKPELLDGCNSYACEICGTKQSAYRRVAIKSAPSLLTISCQRFDIDRKTWQRVKVTSKSEFPIAFVSTSPIIFSDFLGFFNISRRDAWK